MFIVYRYWSPSNKSYIGQTCYSLDRRAGSEGREYTRQNKCPKFANAIKKYGWDWFKEHREILKENLSQEEANKWEAYYIGFFNSMENGYNVLDGNNIGHINNTRKVPVVGINCKTKEIKYYDSISDAASKLNMVNQSITQCFSGRAKTAGGYIWVKKDKYEKMTVEEQQELLKIKERARPSRYKKVYCIETQQIFASIKEAAEFYNLDRSSITKVCKGKAKTCGGKHWCYYKEE